MLPIKTILKEHPVLTYFALVFSISWGSGLAFLGPDLFLGSRETSFVGFSPLVLLAFLAGPSLAGILATALVHGKAGLVDIWARLRTWRVSPGWYAVAILTGPILTSAVLAALCLTSPAFLPALVTSPDKASLLLTGVATALVVPFFEELGWFGFVIPTLRQRHGVLITGLIVGLIWGLWHLPMVVGTARASTTIPPSLYLGVLLFSWLVPYRVLMVWVYDRTQSLLIVMLMHGVIDFGSLVLIPQALPPQGVVTFALAYAALLWLVVAGVAFAQGGHLSQPPVRTNAPKDEGPARTL